jgi:hypothetical protein
MGMAETEQANEPPVPNVLMLSSLQNRVSA